MNSNCIGISEAAQILQVSTATVRNWIKADLLSPIDGERNPVFSMPDVDALRTKIESGDVPRLRRRANKSASSKRALHDELVGDHDCRAKIQTVLDIATNSQLSVQDVLYCIAVNMFSKEFGVDQDFLGSRFNAAGFETERLRLVVTELAIWVEEAELDADLLTQHELTLLDLEGHSGLLGIVYQGLLEEQQKGKAGSYYTPQWVISDMLIDNLRKDCRVIDPCCGTGAFLTAAASRLLELGTQAPLDYIFGVDADPIAVRLARLNLLSLFDGETVSEPHVYVGDPLLIGGDLFEAVEDLPIEGTFDLVVSNPPWGAKYNSNEVEMHERIFPEIESGESFSLFIEKGLRLLTTNGRLSYLVPDAILNVRAHRDIREKLVRHTTILRIIELGRVFSEVFTPVVRLDVKKSEPRQDASIKIQISEEIYNLRQSKISNNPDSFFNIRLKDEDRRIISQVRQMPHATLVDNALWALGIVTGNNKQFIHDEEKTDREPVLRGKDIFRYTKAKPKRYIKFTPEKFQQCAKESLYRAEEKLIYRFVTDTLVFCYDTTKALTLNSANILIPTIDDMPVKYVLAVLNSSLVQFILQKEIAPRKILRSHLESLPIPRLDADRKNNILDLTEVILSPLASLAEKLAAYEMIDRILIHGVGLADEDIAKIWKEARNDKWIR